MQAFYSFLRKRPLAAGLLFFLVTSFLLRYLRPSLTLLVCVTLPLLLLFVFLFVRSFQKAALKGCRTAFALLLAACLVSGATSAVFNHNRAKTEAAFDHTDITATFTVTEVKKHEGVTTLTGALTPEKDATSYKSTVYLFEDALLLTDDGDFRPLETGDVIKGRFQLTAVSGKSLSELYQYADGYTLSGSYLGSAELLGKTSDTFSVKDRLADLITDRFSENTAAVMKALLLADKSALPSEVRESFASLGISHLFAVSGLHLSVLVGFFAFLLARFGIGKKLRYALLTLFILFYATLTDFTPSLLRAGGMLLLFYLSDLIGRESDPITSLLSATAAITLVSQRAILDVGLLLSFSATLGILTLASPSMKALYQKFPIYDEEKGILTALRRLARAIASAAILTLSASAYCLIFLVALSGELFLLSPLSNLIFAPLFTLLLWLTPLFLITAAIPIVSGIPTLLIELLSRLVLFLSRIAKPLEVLTFSLDYRFVPYLIALLSLVALVFLFFGKRKSALAVLSAFFLLLPIGAGIDYAITQNSERVAYLSNGTSDILLIESKTHRLAVVFSHATSFPKRSIENGSLTTPSAKTDTVLFATPTNQSTSLLYELWQEGSVSHILLPDNAQSSASLAAFAQELGLSVTRYTPNDTLLYNGIPIKTYASSGGETYALTVTLSQKSVTYIRENAPNDFDIRFGILKEPLDILIHGAYGDKMKGSLSVEANEVWEYTSRGYIPLSQIPHHRLGNSAISNRTKNQE